MTDNKEEYKVYLLDNIKSSADVRKLDIQDLPQLCEEVRSLIIENLAVNPGHFASSMGAVDLIVALHYVFDTPTDHLVWDVGHQAYAHKILTGRKDVFSTQRTLGGISGFPNPLESESDTFVAGHAGNSISAALGMAIADKNTPGHESRKTVAIIGDASISGGLAFEGLNNASNHPNDLLIILNDNDMSIDKNVGALHNYLSHLTTSAGYNKLRNKLAIYLRKKGVLTENRRRALIRFGNSIKSLVSRKQNIFEGLNIRYFGPFDGHDVINLVKILKEIKDMQGPRILHLNTIKGKGFKPAEENPAKWHAPGKFNPETGEINKKTEAKQPLLWQEVFGKTLVELAKENENIMAITAAMPSGTSISYMMEEFPERTFDVGISEGHAVTFAGGLAAGGKKPFVAIYSSFLQRAYDNIIHDVAIQGLPVTFCIDRAGLVGEDGVTHHGTLDLAYLNCIPGMNVAAPSDEETLRNLMYSSLNINAPLAIRYPRGKSFNVDWETPFNKIETGKGRPIIKNEESKIAILSLGPIINSVKEAIEEVNREGIKVDLYDMIWLKPLDMSIIEEAVKKYKSIITIEDGAIIGGFGSSVNAAVKNMEAEIKITNLGIPDKWITHGSLKDLYKIAGIDKPAIVRAIKNAI